MIGSIGIFIAYVVFLAMPTEYLKDTAVAGGIALVNTVGMSCECSPNDSAMSADFLAGCPK